MSGPRPVPPLRDALAIAAALILLMAWDLGGGDLALSRLYGNADGFPWRNHWLTAGVVHEGSRILAWLVFAVLAISVWRPLSFASGLNRRERVWWAATALGCAALIPLLRQQSLTSCPWSLAEFGGGPARHVSHWLLGQGDGGPGKCFPSGNASTAFAFLGGWFALRGVAPRAARVWLGVTVVLGGLFGWVQMMRGALIPTQGRVSRRAPDSPPRPWKSNTRNEHGPSAAGVAASARSECCMSLRPACQCPSMESRENS